MTTRKNCLKSRLCFSRFISLLLFSVTVFGYRWQGGKYIGDDNAHDVADVTCITECEMIKPHSQVLSESTTSQLAVCIITLTFTQY